LPLIFMQFFKFCDILRYALVEQILKLKKDRERFVKKEKKGLKRKRVFFFI